eukprot:3934547-Rhodomonas_salina.5
MHPHCQLKACGKLVPSARSVPDVERRRQRGSGADLYSSATTSASLSSCARPSGWLVQPSVTSDASLLQRALLGERGPVHVLEGLVDEEARVHELLSTLRPHLPAHGAASVSLCITHAQTSQARCALPQG